MRFNSKNQKFNNLSKTASFVEIFQREPRKLIILVKKVVKNRRFWVIFSTKTRYCSLDSLDRGTKVGLKMKYNCYILQIKVLKFFIWFWWGGIRVRSGNLVKNRNFDLLDNGYFLSSKWSSLIENSIKWTLTQFYGIIKGLKCLFYQLSFLRFLKIPCCKPNISPPRANKLFQDLDW